MMMKQDFIISFALLIYSSLFAQSYQAQVEQFIKNNNYSEQSVGVIVKEIGKKSTLVSINHDKLFIPASVMKLVTATAAFDLLGMNYVFKTDVYIDGNFSKDSGIVDGNLYIRGGGDPGFLVERLWLFVQHLTHCGIKKIKKDLILDDTFFDIEACGPGYGEDQSSRAYEAPIAALSASFNTVAIHIAPGTKIGEPVFVTPFPRMKGVKITSTAKTKAAGSSSGLQVKTEDMDGKTAILVLGSMGLDEKSRYIYRKIWNTWENFGWVLQGFFEESGIEFNGNVRHEAVPDSINSLNHIYTFFSRPLSEFIYNMFKYSSNFAADMIFNAIASEQDNLPGSWKRGKKIIEKWWEGKNMQGKITHAKNISLPVIKNGSGMGDENRLSADHITALLEYVWRQKKYLPEFISALSTAGVDGTLATRFLKSPLKGIVRAKTGTLNSVGVSNLAGYILLPHNTYTFAVFVNDKKQSQYSHWILQQKILEIVFASWVKKKRAQEQ